MSDHELRRLAIIKFLSHRYFSLNRAVALAKKVAQGIATRHEEAIHSKSRKMVEICDEFVGELIEYGIDHLGCDLSKIPNWPSSSFSGVTLRFLAYLAATPESDGGQRLLEELKELHDRLDKELPNMRLSDFH